MNIFPFQINVPAEVTLERPEGTLVQGRYGDRVMFTLADGRIMYVPPFVANKIQADGVAPGDRFQLCKTQVRNGNRRSIEWTVRRLDPSEPSAETPLERDLRASLESATTNVNGNGNMKTLRHLPCPPLQPSLSTPSKPPFLRPSTPSASARNWATWCGSMRMPSRPWQLRYSST